MNIELNRTYFRLHCFRSCFDQNALRAYFSLHSFDSKWRNKVHFYSHTLSSLCLLHSATVSIYVSFLIFAMITTPLICKHIVYIICAHVDLCSLYAYALRTAKDNYIISRVILWQGKTVILQQKCNKFQIM